MASIFTKIVNGEIPCYKIAEDEHFLCFLDVRPLTRGHCLVIPKTEIDYIFDIPTDQYTSLHLFAAKIAKAVKQAIPCTKVGMAVIGLEVPHAHIHLVPMNAVSDMNFSNERQQFSPEEYQQIAREIASYL